MDILKKYMKISLFILISVSLIAILLYSFHSDFKETNLYFADNTLEELRSKFNQTPSDSEFVAFLILDNKTVTDWKLIGFKNLSTNKPYNLTKDFNLITNATIHSHPGNSFWSCWISPIDKQSLEDIVCIYCKNEVKCYEK